MNKTKTIGVATLSDYPEIVKVFGENRDIFPHIRTDYIHRMIEQSKCVYQDGIVITFNVYKRNNAIGTVIAPRGSCTIKQIVNANKGNGVASTVLNEFLDWMGTDTYLSVREDNLRAIRFYLKNGFEWAGTTSWKNGTIPGNVYVFKH